MSAGTREVSFAAVACVLALTTPVPVPAIIVEVDGKIVSVDMPKPDPVYFNARLRGITSRVSFARIPFARSVTDPPRS